MNLTAAISLTAHLLAIALGLQAIEVFFITRTKSFLNIWSFENLKSDLEKGIPLPNSWIKILFSITGFKTIVILQIVAAIAGFLTLHPLFLVILFFTHLLICIRFRGTFNGGSDMMGFVVLTGVLISLIGSTEITQKLGLIYIAIHTLYSYFKAGIVKIINTDWRSGKALPVFLQRSLFPNIVYVSKWLHTKTILTAILSFGVLFFEISIIALPFFPHLLIPYFVCAMFFHFIIYLSFGLNRFFWIWLSAWPAVIYSVYFRLS